MYRFRITFSTDVNEHYKGDGTDTTASLTIDSDTWKKAEAAAEKMLKHIVSEDWINEFEMVSVQNVTLLKEEEGDDNG